MAVIDIIRNYFSDAKESPGGEIASFCYINDQSIFEAQLCYETSSGELKPYAIRINQSKFGSWSCLVLEKDYSSLPELINSRLRSRINHYSKLEERNRELVKTFNRKLYD